MKVCKRCFSEINDCSIQNLINKNLTLCHKCLLELRPVFNEFSIGKIKATNVYWYTNEIQSMLYQFKGCNDIELKNTFFDYYFAYFKSKYRNYLIIPAPSSEEVNIARGFNQVEEMFEGLHLKMVKCIHKTANFQQHNLTSEQRENIGDLLKIDDINLQNKLILLVDDVYTTGSTIKKIIELVQSKNPKKIEVLVMSKTKDLDQR